MLLDLQILLEAADVESGVAFLVVAADDWAAVLFATVAEADGAVNRVFVGGRKVWNVEDAEQFVVNRFFIVIITLRVVDFCHFFHNVGAAMERDGDFIDTQRVEKFHFDKNFVAELHESPVGL